MIVDAQKIVLKNEGWHVDQEGKNFFVYRHTTKATVYPFEDEERAWEWLIGFLKGLEGVGIGTNMDN